MTCMPSAMTKSVLQELNRSLKVYMTDFYFFYFLGQM